MSAIDWTTIKNAIQAWIVAGSGLAADHVIWEFDGGNRPTSPFVTIAAVQIDQPAHDYTIEANNPLTFASVNVTPDHTTSSFAAPSHGLVTGDGPVQVPNPPTGVAAETDYWLIAPDANTLQLAARFRDTGGNYPGNPITPVTFADDGPGGTSFAPTEDTVRAGQEITVTAHGIRAITFQMQCFGGPKSGTLPMQILGDVIASLQLHVDDLNAAGIGFTTVGVAEVASGIKLVPDRINEQIEPTAIVAIVGYAASELVGLIGRVDEVQIMPVVTLEDGSQQALPEIDLELS